MLVQFLILAQSVNLQRELKKLQFKNPGEAMIGNSKIKTNPQRPKRKVAGKFFKNNCFSYKQFVCFLFLINN